MKVAKMVGAAFLQTALLLPVLVTTAFGYLTILEYYDQKRAMIDVSHAIGRALQENPNLRANGLYQYVKTLSSSSAEFVQENRATGGVTTAPCSPELCRIKGLEIRVVSSETAPNSAHFTDITALDKEGDGATDMDTDDSENWKNPRLDDNADSTTSGVKWVPGNWHNDRSPYFVGVQLNWQPKLPFKLMLPPLANITTRVAVPIAPKEFSVSSLRLDVTGRKKWNRLLEPSGGVRRTYCDLRPARCARVLDRCAFTDEDFPKASASLLPAEKTKFRNDRRVALAEKFAVVRERQGCLRKVCRGAFPGKAVIGAFRIRSCNMFAGEGAVDPRDGSVGTRERCVPYRFSMILQCYFVDKPLAEITRFIPAPADSADPIDSPDVEANM